jgi:hypothetical protein
MPLEKIARTIRRASRRAALLLVIRRSGEPAIGQVVDKRDRLLIPVQWGQQILVLELKRGSALAVVKSSSRSQANALAACAGQVLWDDDRALASLKVEKSPARGLCHWVESDIHPRPGAVVRLVFSDVRWEGESFERVVLEGPRLADSELVERFWSEESEFEEMKMTAPLFRGFSRQLTCFLSREGRLRLALPDPSDEEARAVVDGIGEEMVTLAQNLRT